MSAETWLTRLSGRTTYQKLWRPLIRSKLGANDKKASAAYIWSVIRRFYGARQGKMKTEMFGYVTGGYHHIVERLAARLRGAGATLEAATPVTAVTPAGAGFELRAGQETRRFDRVVNTCAAPIAMRVCDGLSAEERARHLAISYQGVVCASLLLDRPLGGAYLTYITDESVPFTTVIEMSSLIDASLTDGKLNLVAISDPTFISFFVLIWRMFRKKLYLSPRVTPICSESFTLRMPTAGFFHVDGEIFECGPLMTIKACPKSLRIVAISC